MLTPLQEQVAQIIAGLEEAREFALAGGAALIARGDEQRETRDLDFFGLSADAVDRLVPAVDRALRDAGLTVRHVQVSPGFARLIVESADDRTELDLAADARLYPAEPGRPAPMLTGEELAVDKLLALFGRAEARDFVDLMEVEPRLGPPGASDVFVTSADDIAGMSSAQIAKRLALYDDAGRLRSGPFSVFEFDTPAGIASPVFRNTPGFVGRGRTAGGATEFVVPNQWLSELQNLRTWTAP